MTHSSSWKILSDQQQALALLESFCLGSETEEKLWHYCRLLQDYNRHTNLVSNASMEVLLKEHLLDSLQLLSFVKTEAHLQTDKKAELVDVGSGAGFPGLVLAISNQDLNVTLIDSIGKKCRFLELVCSELGLEEQVQVVPERAETLGREPAFRESFDFATARAVASLPVVSELCLPLLHVQGLLLAQRSKKQVDLESKKADSDARRIGGRVKKITYFEPDLLGREFALIIIEKTSKTPARYPRSAAEIKKANKN